MDLDILHQDFETDDEEEYDYYHHPRAIYSWEQLFANKKDKITSYRAVSEKVADKIDDEFEDKETKATKYIPPASYRRKKPNSVHSKPWRKCQVNGCRRYNVGINPETNERCCAFHGGDYNKRMCDIAECWKHAVGAKVGDQNMCRAHAKMFAKFQDNEYEIDVFDDNV